MSIANQRLPKADILSDIQVLLIDNDRDSQTLYTFLLESYGAKVTSLSSVKDALDFLSAYVPAILICDLRFLGETVDPLIQRARELARHHNKIIPILATSTYSPMSLAQKLKLEVDSHLRKPIDIDRLVEEVWHLTLLQGHTETGETQFPDESHQPIFHQDLLAWKRAKLEQLV